MATFSSMVKVLTCVVGLASLSNAIENGEEASVSEFAFAASVQRAGRNKCGGTLVNADWVLTTHNCFLEISSGSSAKAMLKQFNVRGENEEGAKARNILEDESVTNGQVAMLKLNNPINPISPVSISSEAVSADQAITIVGWGKSSAEEDFSNDIQNFKYGNVTVSTSDNDESFMGESNTYAGCDGDEGGPALVATESGYVQVGIITGYSGCNGTSEVPEVTYFISSAAFKTFVEDTINPPTGAPTQFPTTVPPTEADPTAFPTTSAPTLPTPFPTTAAPTVLEPTSFPTTSPIIAVQPTGFPTTSPVTIPPTPPTQSPTNFPTLSPSKMPTMSPTISPTLSPTKSPISLADWQELQDDCREWGDENEEKCNQRDDCEYLQEVARCRTVVERPPDPPTARPTTARRFLN